MEHLKDYSGEFRPDLDLGDFSKDFLLNLKDEWARNFKTRFSDFLGQYVKTKLGKEGEDALHDITVGVLKDLAPKLAELANIKVKTLVDAQKVCQLLMDGAVKMGPFGKADIKLKSPNHMIMTIKTCPILDNMEDENAPAEEYACMCVEREKKALEAFFGALLPDNVQAKPVKSPPRKDKDDIACRWEITR